MKIEISSISPDGVEVVFKQGFVFSTYQEAFDFIRNIDRLYCIKSELNKKELILAISKVLKDKK